MSTPISQQLFTTAQAQLASEITLANNLLTNAIDTAGKLSKLHSNASQALLARNLAAQRAANQGAKPVWWQDPTFAEANLIAAFNWFQEAGNIALAGQADQLRLVQSQVLQLPGQAATAAKTDEAPSQPPLQQLVGQAMDLANTGYAQMMQGSGAMARLINDRADALRRATPPH